MSAKTEAARLADALERRAPVFEGVPSIDCAVIALRSLAAERDELASRVRELEGALTEARRWFGDGEYSDGLPREYWTTMHTAAVELVDAALIAPKEQP